MIVNPESSLFRGDALAVQLGKAHFPFLYDLQCLTAALFGTSQHPFGVCAVAI